MLTAGAKDKSDPANVPKEAVESEEKAVEEAVGDLEAMKHKSVVGADSEEAETGADTDKSGAETKAADESKEVPEAAEETKEVSEAAEEPKQATETTEAAGTTQSTDSAKETANETTETDTATSVDSKTEVKSDSKPTEEASTKTTEKSADLTAAVADTPAAPSDKSAEKSEPAAAAAPARPATDPNQVYLYTSLAGAGIHIIPDTNRLQGILKAYKIDFELVDLGTNERAKRIWRYRGQGRKLPAVVRDDEVKGVSVPIVFVAFRLLLTPGSGADLRSQRNWRGPQRDFRRLVLAWHTRRQYCMSVINQFILHNDVSLIFPPNSSS